MENDNNNFCKKNHLEANPSIHKLKDYEFINFIRFISIIGITSLHSIHFGMPEDMSPEDFLRRTDKPFILIIFYLLLRFSVISFCMSTGFLLGRKMVEENRLRLFVVRLKNILPPYIIALLLTGLFIFIRETFKNMPTSFFGVLQFTLFNTSFWYIPSTLLSLLFLLFLLKKLPQMYLGIFLFIITIVITLKFFYIESKDHTDPIFFPAYAFYIWLGSIIWKYNWVEKIKKSNLRVLLLLWLLSFILLYSETYFLFKNNNPIILHNLKISNQIYAVISFIMLIRISEFVGPLRIINVRNESYGVYLYSTVVGFLVAVFLHKMLGYFNLTSTLLSILYSILHFIITFILTILLVKFLSKFRLLYLQRD